MKSFTALALGLSAFVSQTSGHYIFQQFNKNAVGQYVRPNSNYNSPVTDLTSNDLRCNVGGLSGASTKTTSVKAGDAFTITADIAVYHQGPMSFYMAKVPTGQTAASFDGSGKVWFKIQDVGPTFDASGNANWQLTQTYTSKFPAGLPSGDYLLRTQQLAIHNPWPAGIPQFYIGCTQVTVTNGGSGTPGPVVAIPGAFSSSDPGYTVNIYSNFKNYTVPGPAVWNGK